jgi:hypothetical protein
MISSNMYWHEVKRFSCQEEFSEIWQIHAKCPSFLFGFNLTWISQAHSNKNPPVQNFIKIMSQVVQSAQLNGQSVTFCNLVNPPKNMFTPNCHTALHFFFLVEEPCTFIFFSSYCFSSCVKINKMYYLHIHIWTTPLLRGGCDSDDRNKLNESSIFTMQNISHINVKRTRCGKQHNGLFLNGNLAEVESPWLPDKY